MKISILTLFPTMIKGFLEESIMKRAQEKKLVEIEVVNLRDFAKDNYGTVDDKPYGGGAGMVIRVDVLDAALKKIKEGNTSKQKTVLTSAKGRVFNQTHAQEYAKLDHLVIVAGHYEAVDERIMSEIDDEVSMGDFVMTGGEITAAAMVDAIVRLIPGVLKKEAATVEESFYEVALSELVKACGSTEILAKLQNRGIEKVQLLEYPHYTRPEEYKGVVVPEVLLSGDHAAIQRWRLVQSYNETVKKRPDLLS